MFNSTPISFPAVIGADNTETWLLSWFPSTPGIYEATVFGWLDADSNTPAFSPKSIKFEVLPSLITPPQTEPALPFIAQNFRIVDGFGSNIPTKDKIAEQLAVGGKNKLVSFKI